MQECTVGSMCIKASPSCPTSLSSLFFLATWWVSWCAPVWTYNLGCLRCLFQTAAAWFPCIITTGRCVHRVVRSWDPTALRRASKPQKLAAARVRVGLCGHSWATQNWHIKQKVMGLSRGHTIQHLIPMNSNYWLNYIYGMGVTDPLQQPHELQIELFFLLRYRLYGELCTCNTSEPVRSAMIGGFRKNEIWWFSSFFRPTPISFRQVVQRVQLHFAQN